MTMLAFAANANAQHGRMPKGKVGQRMARTGIYCPGDGRARLKQNDVQLFAPRCSLTDVTNSQPSRPTRLSSAATFCWSSMIQTELVIHVCSQRVGFVPARTGETMILGATAAAAHPATIPAKINTTFFRLVFMPAMLTRLQDPGVRATGAGVQSEDPGHRVPAQNPVRVVLSVDVHLGRGPDSGAVLSAGNQHLAVGEQRGRMVVA